jgi:D-sedoheptulose 7-phosphate isomerase
VIERPGQGTLVLSDAITAVHAALEAHEAAVNSLRTLEPMIAKAASALAGCLAAGGQVLFCGNGGSAADAQHLSAEFVGRLLRERRAFPAIALHANSSALTALGNDYGFDAVFARQVEAFGRGGDTLVAISTSGNSPNVLRAVETARRLGLTALGLSGGSGGALAQACHLCITVPSESTPRVQEAHILIGHILCSLVEDALCCETEVPPAG